MRASAFFRRGFLAPRSRASVPARSRGLDPAPAHDDDDSSSSDDGGPQVYTAPRPASTLSIGETPLIGRAGRAIFGCGFRSLPICFCLRPCPPPSCSPDEALTDAAVHRRSRGKLYVDYLYLESILAPELRRIFATDTVQLGTRPLRACCRVQPVALLRAAAATLSHAWPTARAPRTPAADGVACSGQPQGHSQPVAVLEDLWSAAVPAGAPCPARRAAFNALPPSKCGAAPPQAGALQARVVR